MPHITTDSVNEKRKALKKAFPNLKLSVTRRHYSGIIVSILSGNLDITIKDLGENCNGKLYQQVNPYYIEDHYKDSPELKVVLLKIKEIINSNNGIETEDLDYGLIPDFYISINIGEWDKPYVKTV